MKIFCIGRNYTEHAIEMKNDVPKQPIIFMKPPTALLHGNNFYLPEFSNDIHYECELVFKINGNVKHVEEKFAHKYYDAVTVGIDFTARDIQADCKAKGLPWEIAKGFDNSAVLGEWVATNTIKNPSHIQFALKKNGIEVQNGNSQNMLFSINKIISYISSYFTLNMGDVIYTGTPAGVGAIVIGDKLEGFMEGEKKFEVIIK